MRILDLITDRDNWLELDRFSKWWILRYTSYKDNKFIYGTKKLKHLHLI